MTRDQAMGDGGSEPRTRAALDGPALFTWTAWGVSLALALVYVRTFGKNLPFQDE